MAKDGGGAGREHRQALMLHLSHLLEQPQSHQRLFEDKVSLRRVDAVRGQC